MSASFFRTKIMVGVPPFTSCNVQVCFLYGSLSRLGDLGSCADTRGATQELPRLQVLLGLQDWVSLEILSLADMNMAPREVFLLFFQGLVRKGTSALVWFSILCIYDICILLYM